MGQALGKLKEASDQLAVVGRDIWSLVVIDDLGANAFAGRLRTSLPRWKDQVTDVDALKDVLRSWMHRIQTHAEREPLQMAAALAGISAFGAGALLLFCGPRQTRSSVLGGEPDSLTGVDRYIRAGVSGSLSLRCAERQPSTRLPVRIVVFDMDETLSMATHVAKQPCGDEALDHARLVDVNFSSPWVPERLEKLRLALECISKGLPGGEEVTEACEDPLPKTLAVLSRRWSGPESILKLLRLAKLDVYFSCIWTMASSESASNGLYRTGLEWKAFPVPFGQVADHKADVLHHICQVPRSYFPQLALQDWSDGVDNVFGMSGISPEQVVLVDSRRETLTSDVTGAEVVRSALVARYDAPLLGGGGARLRDAGGLGAQCAGDFDALCAFCRTPWEFPECPKLTCWQSNVGVSPPLDQLSLVVFNFDETLTLTTFLPSDKEAFRNIGWKPRGGPDWTEDEIVQYNFESPFIKGSRVEKLKAMFSAIAQMKDCKQQRVLAVVVKNSRSQNEGGSLASLNLLKLAGLDQYFSAIWGLPNHDETSLRAHTLTSKYLERRRGGTDDHLADPNGIFRDSVTGEWKVFQTPLDVPKGGLRPLALPEKGPVLRHIAAHPKEWFPQLKDRGLSSVSMKALLKLKPENICLVDNERRAFRGSSGSLDDVLRCAFVASYDASYRDCGKLLELGGIGAHSDEDYEMLSRFVEKPWEFPRETHGVLNSKQQKNHTQGAPEFVRCERADASYPGRFQGSRLDRPPRSAVKQKKATKAVSARSISGDAPSPQRAPTIEVVAELGNGAIHRPASESTPGAGDGAWVGNGTVEAPSSGSTPTHGDGPHVCELSPPAAVALQETVPVLPETPPLPPSPASVSTEPAVAELDANAVPAKRPSSGARHNWGHFKNLVGVADAMKAPAKPASSEVSSATEAPQATVQPSSDGNGVESSGATDVLKANPEPVSALKILLHEDLANDDAQPWLSDYGSRLCARGHIVTFLLPEDSQARQQCQGLPQATVRTYSQARSAEDPESYRALFFSLLKEASVCIALVSPKRGTFQSVEFISSCIQTANLSTYLIAKASTTLSTIEKASCGGALFDQEPQRCSVIASDERTRKFIVDVGIPRKFVSVFQEDDRRRQLDDLLPVIEAAGQVSLELQQQSRQASTISSSSKPRADTAESESRKSVPEQKTFTFKADNSRLRADTLGIGFRISPNSADVDPKRHHLTWGKEIVATVVNDDWVQVGRLYLPRQLKGIEVLKKV